MKKYYRLGKIFNIEIGLHYSWFFIFALLAYVLTKDYFPQHFPNLLALHYWVIGILSALLLFVSVLAHELCHSLVAKHFKIPIRKIQLFFFGGLAEMNEENIKPKTELLMALAGPLFSIIFGIFCLYLLTFSTIITITAVLHYLGRINLVLGIFNLMPGFPLDGGRALRAIMWLVSKNYEKSTYYATRSGKVFGGFLVLMGFFAMFSGNFGGLWFVLIGGFLFFIAEMSFEQVIIKKSLINIKVRDVYQKSFDFLSPDISVNDAIKKVVLHSSQDFFPVLDNKKNFLGAVSIKKINQVPDAIKTKIKVKSIMFPAKKLPSVALNQEIYPILSKMLRQQAPFLPVLRRKKLIGIITKESIVHFLKLKM